MKWNSIIDLYYTISFHLSHYLNDLVQSLISGPGPLSLVSPSPCSALWWQGGWPCHSQSGWCGKKRFLHQPVNVGIVDGPGSVYIGDGDSKKSVQFHLQHSKMFSQVGGLVICEQWRQNIVWKNITYFIEIIHKKMCFEKSNF